MVLARTISRALVTLACTGLILPQAGYAGSPRAATEQAKPPVLDLTLGARGSLQGQVVTAANAPLANQPVLLVTHGKKVMQTTTDSQGRFSVDGLRGGTYAIGTPGTFAIYRVWTQAAAPPSALHAALLVDSGHVVRGQGRLWYWLTDPYFLAAGLGVALAVAIAADNRKSGS